MTKKQKGAASVNSIVAGPNGGSSTLLRQPSHVDLSKCFGKSSYFSDINPRSMKRLMNILAVTGIISYMFLSLAFCIAVSILVVFALDLRYLA